METYLIIYLIGVAIVLLGCLFAIHNQRLEVDIPCIIAVIVMSTSSWVGLLAMMVGWLTAYAKRWFRRMFATPKSCKTCRYYRQQRQITPLSGLCVAGKHGSCVDFSMWEAKDE